MHWLRQFVSDSVDATAASGLPRTVLRHLIDSHEIGIGSRLLDAGCGRGELVRVFDLLGIDSVGLDESAENVAAARVAAPHCEFHHASAGGPVPVGSRQFDLVLARHLRAYRQNLLCASALRATANLLSHLRPGGYLVFVARSSRRGRLEPAEHETRRPAFSKSRASGFEAAEHEGSGPHSLRCFARHLATFPGTFRTREFAAGLNWAESWRQVLGRPRRPGFLTATICIPREPLSRAEWLQLADATSRSQTEPCCRWGVEADGLPADRRKVA